MTTPEWARIDSIFQSVVDLPEGDRERALAEACGGDAVLRAEVESLLRAEGLDLISPAIAGAALELESEPGAFQGLRVGAWRLVGPLGEGGMGSVFRAERADGEFTKTAAIKFVRVSAWSAGSRERFLAEREILARLEHPHIARLLDGGVVGEGEGPLAGMPYLVMEFVEGVPITEYCDTHKPSIAERVDLFRKVCEGVHAAHQNLVIHRDLKPANILVTHDGLPKLVDFGIAKTLDRQPSAPATEVPILTPDYASPEQVRGESVTTAADVYSLGAVLYELLSGTRPHRFTSRTPADIERVVCEVPPALPSEAADASSAARRALRGDLDNIVLKAMRKEPERRYASVAELSEDLRSYLRGQPVVARGESARYRASKFVARNRMAAGAAVVLALSLVGGIVATSWQAARAEREAELARSRFNEARTLIAYLMDSHERQLAKLPGSLPLRANLIETMVAYLDRLAAGARGDVGLERELAQGYYRVAVIQGHPSMSNLGQRLAALESMQKSHALWMALAQRPAADAADWRELLNVKFNLTDLLVQSGNAAEIRRLSADAEKAGTRMEALGAMTPKLRAVLASRLGLTALRLGDVDACFAHYRELLRHISLWRKEGGGAEALLAERNAHHSLSAAYRSSGDLKMSTEHMKRALAIMPDLSEADLPRVERLFLLAFMHHDLANRYGEADEPNMGDIPLARKHWSIAADAAAQARKLDPRDIRLSRRELLSRTALARTESSLRRAVRELLKVEREYAALLGETPNDVEHGRDQAAVHRFIGEAYAKAGDTSAARAWLERALAGQRDIVATDPYRVLYQADMVWTLVSLYRTTGAETYRTEGREIAERVHQQAPAEAIFRHFRSLVN
ncbi:MAG TPA: serine/threonine-protein kinase [Bryobacteraceae bacterium]|nr:serine/threonine-protein kinase [Bryobacteraceae bacterium]